MSLQVNTGFVGMSHGLLMSSVEAGMRRSMQRLPHSNIAIDDDKSEGSRKVSEFPTWHTNFDSIFFDD